VFTPEALTAIFTHTGGVPRLINILADKALLRGFVKERFTLDHIHIQECIQEMDGEHLA
jgi:general secretion pathway protein A